MRSIIRLILKNLAQKSLTKYNSKLVLIYGWDWSEGLREGLYNLLKKKESVRRNTDWIRWDMGLPLFILGHDYNKELSRFKLTYIIIKSTLKLLIPSRYKNNYLVVSLHAKNFDTLNYWFSFEPLKNIILLPLKEYDQSLVYNIEKLLPTEDENSLVDLRPEVFIKELNPPPNPFLKNKLSLKLKQLLWEINENRQVFDYRYTDDDIDEAVIKIDWEKYLLQRLKNNLLQEED